MRRAGRAELAALIRAKIAAAPTGARAAGTVEQGQLAAKTLQHHLGRVAVLAGLILPFSRLQRAFDENLRAFLKVLLGDPAQILVEDDDAVPFGFLTPLAGRLVFPRIRSRDAQIGNRPAVLGAADFRIRAEIADQDNFVDAACHDLTPLARLSAKSRWPPVLLPTSLAA